MVFHLLEYLGWVQGWVDFYLDDAPYCLAAQPILPDSCLPKHNWADSGTTKIKANPTQVSDQMSHLVEGQTKSARGLSCQ